MNIIQILFNPPSSFPRFEPDVFSLILVLLDVIKFLNSNRRDGYRLVEFAAMVHQSASVEEIADLFLAIHD